MLTCLRLRAWLITSYQKKSTIHYSCSSKHCAHQHIMTWAINEWYVTDQQKSWFTARSSALGRVFFLWTEGLKAFRRLASGALVKLSVGISKLDSNISDDLLVMFDSLYYNSLNCQIEKTEKISLRQESEVLTLTPEIARTKVDLPWATWPMVPMLMVAWREMISGVSGVSFVISALCY